MSSYFICIPKSFEFEVNVPPSFAIEDHPLKPTKVISVVDKGKKTQFAPELDGFDPLSQLAAEAEFVSTFCSSNFSYPNRTIPG